MQITRQQRVNSVPGEMITDIRKTCERFRGFLKDGIKLASGTPPGFPAFECTGGEIKEAFGESLKEMETLIAFVLDGKSNKMPKPDKKA